VAGLGLIAAAMLLVSVCACGGGRSRAAVSIQPAKAVPAEGKKKVWNDDCPEPPGWGEDPPPKPPPPPPPAASRVIPVAAKEKVDLPHDVTQWKPNDFRIARRNNDPRLIEAVAYLGKHFATNENAELLVKLIAPQPADDAAGRAAYRPVANPALIEAVVAALAANRSAAARQILERLVAGAEKTVDPQVAAAAALDALLQRPGPKDEDLLFRLITAPEQAATTDGTAIDCKKLRSAALVWVKSSASEAFRLRLANFMTAAKMPAAVYDQIWAALSEARVENLAAQLTLYRGDRLADRDKQSLERQFAEQSREEWRRLIGCSAAEPYRASADAAAVAGSRPACELLWTASFAKLVEVRLRAAEGSDRGARLMSLASTIPCSAMRAAVLRSMEQYWEEGSKRLEPFAASEQSLPEPGFLLLVKQLPRKDPPAATANGAAGDRGGAARLPAGKAAKLAAARQVKERQDQAAQQWLAFSEKLAQAMCRQMKGAAFARPDSQQAPADFPIKLPATAIVAAHRVDWFKGIPGAAAELRLPPLRVCYVRIERKARPDKVASYFRRQLPSAAQHTSDHGVWLDDFSLDRRKGSARSVDVFISKPNRDVGILLDQEQQVIVEILSVETLSQADN
jgi:hypothetical protein